MALPSDVDPERALNRTLTAVGGVEVGHWTDVEAATGCTVVLTRQGAVGGVDVRGAAPGTRETDLLDPVNTVEQVHAVMLAGGSAFGLDAAGGVMRWLEERGHGFEVGGARVPIVCAAVLFDLAIGRADVRPGAAAGYAACEAASAAPVPFGSVGAGTGATVGKALGIAQSTKSGLGSAARRLGSGVTIAALAAVNAGGDVIDASSGAVLAGARAPAGGFLGTTEWLAEAGAGAAGSTPPWPGAGGAGSGSPPSSPGAGNGPSPQPRGGVGVNTTLVVVATDAVLTKAQANRVATVAHDGLARSIDPCHTPLDGDVVFTLATGDSGRVIDLTVLGAVASRVVADAVVVAVRSATGLAGIPSLTDLGTASPGDATSVGTRP